MAVKITSDSTCDLSPELLETYDITLTPLTIILDGKAYRDGVDIQTKDIFRAVSNGSSLPSTTAVSVGEYQECFRSLLERYDAVIHINIGSGFSSSHQNACVAAEELENVFPVDSMNLSTGQGHVVLAAAKAAQEGKSAPEILAMLADLIPRVEASFIIDRLDYMVKGGRCSAVAMLGANLLRLKPCIEVKDGAMAVGKKYRGSFEKCLSEYIRDRLDGRDDIILDRIFITATNGPGVEEDHAFAMGEVEKCSSFENVTPTLAGCTVSSHCGPRTLGVLFVRSR